MHASQLKMGSKFVARLHEQVDHCLRHHELDDAREAVEEPRLSEREDCDRVNDSLGYTSRHGAIELLLLSTVAVRDDARLPTLS